jgi:hypothetical protein
LADFFKAFCSEYFLDLLCLLAGAPFYVSPGELMEMELTELYFWQERAFRRLELEHPKRG